jgi:hypothetical protein
MDELGRAEFEEIKLPATIRRYGDSRGVVLSASLLLISL